MKNKNLNHFIRAVSGMIIPVLLTGYCLTATGTSKEYTDADVAAFVTDLEAGTYDTLILSTSGGIYDVSYPSIPETTVIMGKTGLAEKPVLKNTGNAQTFEAILRVNGSAVRDTVTFINLLFDGSGATTAPLAIRSDDDAHLVFRDCYFRDCRNGNGIIQMRVGGGSLDLQNSFFTGSYRRIVCPYEPGQVFGDLYISNCTFAGADGGSVVYFRSASSVYAAGNNVTIDHCTFYKITSDLLRYQVDSIRGTISVTNSIFEKIGGTMAADVIDYNYLAGFETPPSGTNTIATSPVFADTTNLDFTLTNKDQLVGGDGKTLGDLSWYHEVPPPPNEFTADQVAEFVAALEAGTYDTLILSTSGGIYDVSYPEIPETTVIMGKEGLESRPVLKNTGNTSGSQAILRVNGSAVRDTITFINLEFDGSGAATAPLIIRSDNETHLVFRHCYIHDGTNSGGVIQIRGAGSSVDMQNTLVTKSNTRIICLYTTGVLYGDVNVANCTFSGATGGGVVFFRSASSVFAAGNNVTIDHGTFYDIASDVLRYNADSIHGTISVTNSIFEQIGESMSADIIDYNYLAGFATPPAGTNTITTAPVFADAAGENFTLINKDELTGGDLQILGDLSWYQDTYPPKVLESLIKLDQTHVMVQFNELVDATTATSASNYALSGTAGLTGNPSEALLDANGKDVTLTVGDMSGMTTGQTVIVTVTGVEDLIGNAITENNVATYTLVDETPPVVTLAAQAVTNDDGQTASAQSNETGRIYLVHSDAPQASIDDFNAAIASRMGAASDVTTPDADVQISTAALKVGDYYAYAVDDYNNISEKSSNAVTVSDVTAPVITLPAQEVSNGQLDAALAQSNEPGTIYLILDGEVQSTVSDFEAAVAAKKGASKAVPAAGQDVSISTAGLETGTYYGYAVDEAGNISAKSGNAVTVTLYVPRVRYYESTDAETLVTDLKNAQDGDIFILTTNGGQYDYIGQADITAKVTIMADEDLAERPVLNTLRDNNTKQALRLRGDGASITVKGIEFNSGNRAPNGGWPTKYAIRTDPVIGHYSLIVEDCLFTGIWQADDGSNGAAIKLYNGTYGDSIIFRNCIFEGDEGIVLNNSGEPFGWDKFEISNCTFMNIPDDQAILIIERGEDKNHPLTIDHCTFYNVGGIDQEVIRTDSVYAVDLANSIFATTPADTSWHLWGDLVNQTTVDYVNFFECPEPLTDQGGILGSNKWAYDPMFADPANGDLTLGNSILLSLGSDGLPLGDLRWADLFGPKVHPDLTARSDSTLLIRFSEWIDTATAETAGNYALSGSAGLTGNVKKAELFNFHAVLLTVESFASQVGNEIVVTVSNVEDLKGNVVDPAHDTASYTVEEFRPVVTAEAQQVTNGSGQVVKAQSNQGAGFVYIILDGELQSTAAELDAAVAALKGAKAAVTAAFTDIEISTSGIATGTYYAYATDPEGNLSQKGSNAITVTDGIPPVVSNDIQSVPNGAGDAAIVRSNETGKVYIIMDGVKQETVNDFISAIYAKKGMSSDATVADADVQVSTKDLLTGIYFAYAVDAAGNISLKGSNPINITQSTVGVEGYIEPDFKVYSSMRNIIIESASAGIDRVGIFDLTGRVIIDQKMTTDREEFLMQKQGIYFVRVQSASFGPRTYKLVIQ